MGHPQKEESNGHAIPIRHPHFHFEKDIPPYYFKDNAILSHFMTSYNFGFPSGEQFFVDSVKFFKSRITDPHLSQEMKSFCGQEHQHRNQHNVFIGYFEGLGYNIKSWMKWLKWYFSKFLGFMPPSLKLAITAGGEHLTATIAHATLKNNMLDNANLTMRKLWLWHHMEEIEHKHVAFNVYQAVKPNNYFIRILGYAIALSTGLWYTFYGLFKLLRQDFRQGRLDIQKLKSHGRIFIDDMDMRNFLKYIFMTLPVYLKPGFHPNQIKDQDVIELYLPELKQIL